MINKYSQAGRGGLDQGPNDAADPNKIGQEEQKRLLMLGNLVLVDYVRSMVDLLGQNLEETKDKVEAQNGKIQKLQKKQAQAKVPRQN